MTKKLIPISVILAFAMVLGFVGVASAAYNDVTFSTATSLGGSLNGVVISAGSMVESIIIDSSTVTMTMASGSTITFTSATSQEMSLSPSIATTTYTASGSSLTVPYSAGNTTVILSLSGVTYAPVISTVIVTSATVVTVTFDKNIDYVADSTALIAAGTSFAGVTPISTSISTTALTLTFASGALVAAGVKDDSALVLPAGQIKETARENTFIGTSTQVVTTLAGINQLYDFVFVIQTGQNFMSVPYDVVGPDGTAVSTAPKVAATYVIPNGAIVTYTISDAGGDFANAAAFAPLYGNYINSTANTDVYLRLNKASSQLSPYGRIFSATGWHMIGVASNNVATAINLDTDDDVLSSLSGTANLIPPDYDKVVDMAIGRTNDNNVTVAYADYTYDSTDDCYKALKGSIVTKTKAQIDTASSGIEFNHGEAYFISITGLNASYTGEEVDGTVSKTGTPTGNLAK